VFNVFKILLLVIVFLISFFAHSLLLYRNATDFFLVAMGFELRALNVLGKRSIF
jgi:hypothetical protein